MGEGIPRGRIVTKGLRLFLGLFGLAFPACLLLVCGCEVDSADQAVRIIPEQNTIYQGQTITLRAEGGYFYTWDLEHENWGQLSARRGDSVTYRSLFTPGTTTGEAASVQTVYVYSTYTDRPVNPSGGTSTTGSHDYVDSAQATILHMVPH
jgi:hypothetical protein